jgi:hypothetical protein
MIHVTLTPAELFQGALTGVLRRVQGLQKARRDRNGMDSAGMGWQVDVEGALGELAVAKALGHYWSGNYGDTTAADVRDYQVRYASKAHYRLVLHPDDDPDDIFILVTGAAPDYELRGWLPALLGQLEEYWEDPTGDNRPAYFVPQGLLRDMGDLPRR